MRVFISWSGSLSRETAQSLRKVLPCMIQGMEVFLSQHDIESGARWGNQLAEALQESSFGILCLTPSNQASPWLLYEAGALTKHMEGRACGLLLGDLKAADVSGPLAQFQHRQFNREDCLALVKDINSKANSPLDDTQLAMIFDKWWPDLEVAYQENLKSKGEVASAPQREDRDILEEIVVRLRGIESSRGRPAADSVSISDSVPLLGKLLDTAAKSLAQAQQDLLYEIARGKQRGDAQQVDQAIEDAKDGDLDSLLRAGFVKRRLSGQVRMHKILVAYFSKNLAEETASIEPDTA